MKKKIIVNLIYVIKLACYSTMIIDDINILGYHFGEFKSTIFSNNFFLNNIQNLLTTEDGFRPLSPLRVGCSFVHRLS